MPGLVVLPPLPEEKIQSEEYSQSLGPSSTMTWEMQKLIQLVSYPPADEQLSNELELSRFSLQWLIPPDEASKVHMEVLAQSRIDHPY